MNQKIAQFQFFFDSYFTDVKNNTVILCTINHTDSTTLALKVQTKAPNLCLLQVQFRIIYVQGWVRSVLILGGFTC